MSRILPLFLILFLHSCTSSKEAGSKDASSSSGEEKPTTSEDTATVEGSVTKEDTGSFVDEINVDDWSTFEAQNTAGTNLVLTQTSESENNNVTIYMLDKDSTGVHDFISKNTLTLSEANTFTFKVLPNAYHVVKYKTLTGFVPALTKDHVLPLALNVQSSVAVNLFIRIVQTPEGKSLADNNKINADMLNSVAKKITSSGIGDLAAKIDELIQPIISEQKTLDGDQNKSQAEIDQIVEKIYEDVKSNAVNRAPTISNLSVNSGLSIAENTSSGVINFTIADPDGPLSGCTNATVTVTSSNQNVVTDAALNSGLSGTPPTCHLSFMPVTNATGSTTITLTLTDGTLAAQASFALNVVAGNIAPSISVISDVTISEDATTGNIGFTISDPDGALPSCSGTTVTATSSNQSLVSNAMLSTSRSGTAPNCFLNFSPSLNQNGSSLITVSVSDGIATNQRSFNLIVQPVNDPPTVSQINDFSVSEDVSDSFAFSIADPDGDSLSCGGSGVTVTSSNQALMTDAMLATGRSGAAPNCTVNFTPISDANGTTTITVNVSDGSLSVQETLVITVNAVNDAPTNLDLSKLSIVEGQAINTVFANLTSTDPDAGNTFTYSLVSGPGDSDNSSFNISGANLRVSSVFDYSTKSTYFIRLRTTDSGTGSLFFERSFTLTVTEEQTPILHIAYYDTEAGEIRYIVGNDTIWAPEETVSIQSRPNTDSENIGFALDSDDVPHIGFFANHNVVDGHASFYRKVLSWQNYPFIASHNINSANTFALPRIAGDGNIHFLVYGNSPANELYFTPPVPPYISPQLRFLPVGLNRVDQPVRSCVDEHDRVWVATGTNTNTTQIYLGFRAEDDALTHAAMTTSPDPCVDWTTGPGLDKSVVLDMDCRNQKLTILVACYGNGGGATANSIGYVTKDIPAGTPSLAGALVGQSLPTVGFNLPNSADVYGQVSRINPATGNPDQDLRIAVAGNGATAAVHYFNGTAWSSFSNAETVFGMSFALDKSNNPHIVYAMGDSGSFTEVFHWHHDGANATHASVTFNPVGNSMKLSPDLGISGMPGKSNR